MVATLRGSYFIILITMKKFIKVTVVIVLASIVAAVVRKYF